MSSALIPNYARYDVEFERGEGVRLWDSDGREYLDFLSGIAVCNTGHCHPRVVAAVQEQAARLLHVSNLFYTEPMTRLAERLTARSLGGKVFFCNSGAEANEALLKMARRCFFLQRQPERSGSNRLSVGTAQFGLPYGVANESGQVPVSVASSILSEARAAGVDTLDGFIREMKVRFPDATARTPVSPEMAKGEPVHTGSLPAISGVKQTSAVK